MIEKYKTSPKDIFLQLLAIVTLYGSAVGFLTLLFQFINIQFPDKLEYYSVTSAYSSIRFAVSSLIIVFPVYLWVMRFLEKSYVREPEIKEIRIRKWLVYFTLFAAGLIIMGDLVALVYNFLNGELTARFVLKICSVFLVAGAVFWYYFWDIKGTEPAGMNVFRWAVGGVVAAAIIGAFFVVGSPQGERLRRFDSERVGHLQTIQWQIVNYWQQKGTLPETLSLLEDTISGFRVPSDPDTGIAYEYVLKSERTFELCAVFVLASGKEVGATQVRAVPVPVMPVSEFGANWEHATGRTCFERTIDPDLYPPRSIKEKPVPAR